MAVGRMFGSTWCTRMCTSLPPAARALSTYSLVRMDSVSARTTRARSVHDVRPSTMIRVRRVGSNSDMASSARKKRGIVWNSSVTRISARSTTPAR